MSVHLECDRLSIKRRKSIASLAASAREPPVHFQALRVSEDHLKLIKNRKVRAFYQHQNEIIDRFGEVDRVIEELQHYPDSTTTSPTISHHRYHHHEADEEMTIETPLLPKKKVTAISDPQWLIHLAINISFVANVVLFLSKMFLAFFSGSIAILASAFESFLDILSNAIIFFTMRIIRQKNLYDYPVGKSRMEPLGIVVFAVVITTSFSQVLITSVERLAQPMTAEPIDLSPIALGLLASNIIVKGILWIWCASIKGSSSVAALAQDHENDVVFNITSTIFPVIAVWADLSWLDPVGAILLSLYIIYEWIVVLLENIRRLTGQAASLDDIKQLTYMAWRFSSKIVAVDTVRAYYVGDRLLVEIDIVLPPDCPLQEAHDVGENLQNAFETMGIVERAFVHLDHTSEHEIEHRRAIEFGE